MKTFIVTYTTNYGLAVMVINSENIENARKEAELNGAWESYDIEELDLKTKGIVFEEWS